MKTPRILLSIIAALALAALFLPTQFSATAQAISAGFLRWFDVWTLIIPSASLIFCIAVCIHPAGKRRIGGEEARPEFRFATWVSMMFAAGMGAGLVFWGAAEPVIHSLSPPPGEGLTAGSPEARERALAITQFHWSLQAWAIYAVAAIAIGISQNLKGSILPSRPFSTLPDPVRRLIDMTALVAVLFGLVASLGQGAFQIGSGLNVISGGAIAEGVLVQTLFMVVLTAAFLTSAYAGLRRGIAILSNVNLILAGALALFVLILGPTGAIFGAFVESTTSYLAQLPSLSVTLRPEGEPRAWTHAWSLVYFLWWVAWTPFVGVFLARISRGRSLRVFTASAVLLPSFLTLVWFAIFGGSALHYQESGIDLGVSDFATAQQAAYVLLDQLPLAFLTQVVTLLLVTIFLITSADSGAYVMAMFAEEDADPSRKGRLFWGLVLSALTIAAILSKNGQDATRALAVVGAIPLTLLLFAQGVAAAFALFRRRAGRR